MLLSKSVASLARKTLDLRYTLSLVNTVVPSVSLQGPANSPSNPSRHSFDDESSETPIKNIPLDCNDLISFKTEE